MYKLWKRIRKYGGCATGITQNVEEILKNEKAKEMLANSELVVMLNQASTDKDELAKNLEMSKMKTKYITNSNVGEGIIKVKKSKIPFRNYFPKDTELYKLMTTKLEETTGKEQKQ